jgi:hypothetical protein
MVDEGKPPLSSRSLSPNNPVGIRGLSTRGRDEPTQNLLEDQTIFGSSRRPVPAPRGFKGWPPSSPRRSTPSVVRPLLGSPHSKSYRQIWYTLYEWYATWRSSKWLKSCWYKILHATNTFNKQVVLKTGNLDNLMGFFCNLGRNINSSLWATDNPVSGMLSIGKSESSRKRDN